ncbi:hypothetical protein BGZ63DRAFT_427804 [Mariannaea sp. PMI_226]|nr:hypothetical protein BGZ63DRAFT_427804 [Mariannaea sp. PMI_226]
MWPSISPIAVLLVLLSSAFAAPPKYLQTRGTPAYNVTGFSDIGCGSIASANDNGYSFTWPVPARAKGRQCFTYRGEGYQYPMEMGSVLISGLPAGECVKIEFGDGDCLFPDNDLFHLEGTRGNGCYNFNYLSPLKYDDPRIFYSIGTSYDACPEGPQEPVPATGTQALQTTTETSVPLASPI